ncbi:uncharacterized protein LOC121726036 [Aricia agestis]|uniref:uncharacterized protein LOC121726036 n=1 Tax=Aricia agestis TaxID=91739 RepID=UPI001C201FD2|nr:uncharacterized protein LOC121726036 [Aricia agestis]
MNAYSSYCLKYNLSFLVLYIFCLTFVAYVPTSGVHGLYEEEICFEIPQWHQKPVEVDQHLDRIKSEFGNTSIERRWIERPRLAFINSEVNKYVDVVIIPFLDTYHRNIQNSFHQLSNKILQKCKEEINAAITTKLNVYDDLTHVADSLNLPASCDEERRAIRTLSSKHVALIHQCTEQARKSISKMGKYAEETISLTSSHMETALANAAKDFHANHSQNINVTECLKELSRAAVTLGYELDLSLTNARRHNEQSCEKLSLCTNRAKKSTEEEVQKLREYLYQCVYA